VELFRRVQVTIDLAQDQHAEPVLKITLQLHHNDVKVRPAVHRVAAVRSPECAQAVEWDREARTPGKLIVIHAPGMFLVRAADIQIHRQALLRREIIAVNNRAAREKQLQPEVPHHPTPGNLHNPGAAVELLADVDHNSPYRVKNF
jgi:hypothetical protein